ncbi:hypothetical protein [Sphingomonas nostoxanthinifaciens]|uniref:hypothetical protein n=1 Tax=Sphingomonas nostoxanthinifaciens TaxID=2872652 RepID=UPI001CC211A3|nr:hypothetical protein [Sphingomonas nostoxanthinifaciens]UAK24331.1 hypothetical protein K8P63_18795 [Sphingomonas nostoxanthinifaciens]
MTVRAKFNCFAVLKQEDGEGRVVKFHTVYSEEVQSEDGRFTKATPWGSLEMLVDNPDAALQFEVGKSYYLDFTPAA